MYNKPHIFKHAHRIARIIRSAFSSYAAAFAHALKDAWRNAKRSAQPRIVREISIEEGRAIQEFYARNHERFMRSHLCD